MHRESPPQPSVENWPHTHRDAALLDVAAWARHGSRPVSMSDVSIRAPPPLAIATKSAQCSTEKRGAIDGLPRRLITRHVTDHDRGPCALATTGRTLRPHWPGPSKID